jgi:phage baseplate assembly protein W
MAVIKKQYYGIKFPFTAENRNGFFLDLNSDLKQKTESEIAHVILTPKGSRLRMPNFGTDIMKYIFNPNDKVTWSQVEEEINSAINEYVPRVSAVSVDVNMNDIDNGATLKITYSISKGNYIENNSFEVTV